MCRPQTIVAARERLAVEPERAEKPSNFLEAMVSARDDEGRPFRDDVIFGNLIGMCDVHGQSHVIYWAPWQLFASVPDSRIESKMEAWVKIRVPQGQADR